ncbi:MAG: hypothetical protein COW18_08445 [Zetaproteobacteria bacterium CG12_big_fil_rev_8_21_14_0_65_54_13]|nr:MAG: hypothetical protein COX55_02370 [Zetaproteobacteria bacterium CG23_combo_of_CG06-09_8_20_14_all_54_7]PIW47976.1 MAG: hypothetical protein COW18_08445 [Zetaproteobacteria bacterium CG12_big_fil_rev_8_21_14_0_65_54_13]PIX54688.1 MAG: hypothetical protein COZ50_06595 [Zetaproteobacteria bacterium CG_4_10_14_3_um_filter_54_28]PJA30947.1 MAG: hypothetical protein CO188_01095 [Zetaproteobacteria bacterium CG_4_9_14_3_um_filter_54_145]
MDKDAGVILLSLPDGSVIRVYGDKMDVSLFVSMLEEDYRLGDADEISWKEYIQGPSDWKLTATAGAISGDVFSMAGKIMKGVSRQSQLDRAILLIATSPEVMFLDYADFLIAVRNNLPPQSERTYIASSSKSDIEPICACLLTPLVVV